MEYGKDSGSRIFITPNPKSLTSSGLGIMAKGIPGWGAQFKDMDLSSTFPREEAYQKHIQGP